jgi:SAM-dependent MidA family methyltransferase
LNPLHQIIAREIQKAGCISFARFMNLTLYCPVYGYYEKEKDNIGRGGDFFTNISVGNVFGELLAFQFAEWFREEMASGGHRGIVESGAYDGQLARDILTWFRRWQPDVFQELKYYIVEPSNYLKSRQRVLLKDFADQVRWAPSLVKLGEEIDGRRIHGVIFSNELLDAMPVHRLEWNAEKQSWFESGVVLENDQFAWTRIPEANVEVEIPKWPAELLRILPDGFITEICPAAADWWSKAGRMLAAGKLMTIDYGLTADERISPERSKGTLRTYTRHQAGDDLLADPGGQDITAHVDFTAIQRAGESVGLKTDLFLSQEEFLTRVAERLWRNPERFETWTADQVRQFKTLVHPEHLGRAFRVLIQSR